VLSAIFNRNPDKRSALPTRFQDNVQRDGIFSRRRILSPHRSFLTIATDRFMVADITEI
jgi:hypothetical protein